VRRLSVKQRERHDLIVHLVSLRFRRKLRTRRRLAARVAAMGWTR